MQVGVRMLPSLVELEYETDRLQARVLRSSNVDSHLNDVIELFGKTKREIEGNCSAEDMRRLVAINVRVARIRNMLATDASLFVQMF